MPFLSPLYLLLGLLAVPILLLYMLKLRRREVEVSSTLLWKLLLRDREANSPWQRLKRNLLLFFQLTILTALVLALARPFLPVSTVAAGTVVLLLDASASMQAADVAPTRFEAAKTQALEIAEDLPRGEEMTVILVAQQPQVLAAGETNRTQLRRAIEVARPTFGTADWSAAAALAAGLAGAATRPATVLIISDGGLPPDLPSLPGEVRYLPIGQSGDNLAISAMALRPGQGGVELFASVTNYGPDERGAVLSLQRNEQLFFAQQLQLPAGESVPVVVPGLPDVESIIEARLTRAPDASASSGGLDSLAQDDVAFAAYVPPLSGRALLVSSGNLFLEQALSVLPGVQSFRIPADQPLPPESFDLYVLDGVWPEGLPEKALLIVNPPPNELFGVGGVFTDTSRASVTEGPLTRFVDWESVHVLQAAQVELPRWAETVIQAEGGPLLFAGEQGGRRIAVLTFDLHDSDLPLQVAFPVLFSNLMDYLAPARAFDAPDGLRPGEVLRLLPGPGIQEIEILDPAGRATVLPAEEGAILFGGANLPGLYTVNHRDLQGTVGTDYFAVNLFDEGESDISPASAITLGRMPVGAASRREIGQRELWPWLAGLALIVLSAEWWLYHRGSAASLGRRTSATLRRFLRPSAGRSTTAPN